MMRVMQPIPAGEAQARAAPVLDEALAFLDRHGDPYLTEVVGRFRENA